MLEGVSPIDELVGKKGFVVTVEVNPPSNADIEEFKEEVSVVKEYVDAVNVTDMPGANLRMSPWSAGLWAVRWGVNPIVQYTCRDRNALALKGDIYGIESLGVRNILVLGGDPAHIGDHPNAKVVYDFDPVSFIDWVSNHTSLCVGAAMNPGSRDWKLEMQKSLAKVKSGARFFQTQAVYEPDKFREFVSLLRKDISVPIIAGIIPLRSEKMAKFMNENIPGIDVPDSLIERISDARDKIACGLDISWEIIEQIKEVCQGIHIMPIRSVKTILPLLKRLREEL